MFNVGQKVICINPAADLIRNRIYTVVSIGICDYCGDSLISAKDNFAKTKCSDCGNIIIGDWSKSSRFRPLKEISETTYDEVMQEFLVPKYL